MHLRKESKKSLDRCSRNEVAVGGNQRFRDCVRRKIFIEIDIAAGIALKLLKCAALVQDQDNAGAIKSYSNLKVITSLRDHFG